MPRPNRWLQRSTVGLQSAATMADLRSISSPSQPRHIFQTTESFPSQQNDIPFAVVLVAALQDWLRGMVLEQERPLLTKSVSSSLIYAAANCTSQMITSPPSGSFDSIRTLLMAAYGLLILGPSQHVWFDFVSKILPKRNLLATLKKIFMGQAIFGPCITTVFFSYNAGLQGESVSEIVARLKRDPPNFD